MCYSEIGDGSSACRGMHSADQREYCYAKNGDSGTCRKIRDDHLKKSVIRKQEVFNIW